MNLFGTPLGVRLPVEVPQRTIPIASGDIIVLHSDGIYETTNAAGEDYGLERLEAVVRTGAPTAEELRDAILRDVAEFRGSEEAADDVTVVVCRML
jgi:sigma-B regulation protein RsbU (phosphoserine phosphatase)